MEPKQEMNTTRVKGGVVEFILYQKMCENEKKFAVCFKKMFSCSQCNKVFKQQRGLTNHEVAHHNTCVVGFSCEICDKRFVTERNKIKHEEKCTENPKMLKDALNRLKIKLAAAQSSTKSQTNCNNTNNTTNKNKTSLNNSLNTVINVLNFDTSALESLQLKHVSSEQPFADFLLKHVIKGDILKTDAARGTITYRLNNGQPPIKDAKGVQLAEKICDFSHDRVSSLNSQAIDRVVQDAGCHRNLFSKIVESQQFVQGLVDKQVNCVEKLGKEIVRRVPTPANKKTFTKFFATVEEWKNSENFFSIPLKIATQGWVDTIDEKIFVLNDEDQWIESPEILMLAIKESLPFQTLYDGLLDVQCDESEREKIRSWIVVDCAMKGDMDGVQKYFT